MQFVTCPLSHKERKKERRGGLHIGHPHSWAGEGLRKFNKVREIVWIVQYQLFWMQTRRRDSKIQNFCRLHIWKPSEERERRRKKFHIIIDMRWEQEEWDESGLVGRKLCLLMMSTRAVEERKRNKGAEGGWIHLGSGVSQHDDLMRPLMFRGAKVCLGGCVNSAWSTGRVSHNL